MGNIENTLELGDAMQMKMADGAYVIADAAAMAGLEAASGGNQPLRASRIEIPLDADVPAKVLQAASIIVIQVEPAHPRSFERIRELRRQRPFMPLIVALADADLTTARSLIRDGVNDVVTLPFDYDQLFDALLNASVGAEDSKDKPPSGELIAIIGATGGCGATTIATHLAAEVAETQDVRSCLIDLDVQFGAVGAYLGLSQQHSIADLLDADTRLDQDILGSVSNKYHTRLDIVTAPHEILPLELIETDQVLRVLHCARQNYDRVFIDLPTNLTNWTLSAILDATHIVMVVELTIPSLRHARRRLDLLREVGVDFKRISLVVNRVEKRLFKTIKLDDAEAALKMPVTGSLPNVPALIGPAQDQGALVGEMQSRNPFSKDMANLALAVSAERVGG